MGICGGPVNYQIYSILPCHAERGSALFLSNFTSNILAGYRFLSEKYKSGDQIFLLGRPFLRWQSEDLHD